MDYDLAPFTIIYDSREQHPYTFQGFRADANRQYRPLVVPVELGSLKTGDYSLKGFEHRIAVERKSKSDCYSTFSQGRERFVRELERMRDMEFACVVIEASLTSCLNDPPSHTKFTKKSFFRTYIRWMVRYRLPFIFCSTRTEAERHTLRILQGFFYDEQDRQKTTAAATTAATSTGTEAIWRNDVHAQTETQKSETSQT